MFLIEFWSDHENVAGFERKALGDLIIGIEALHACLIEFVQ